MNDLTTDIYRWLKELDKIETAKFLKENCSISSNFIDLCWDSNDKETVIVSIDITLPLKKHREINLYQKNIGEIEESIFEYNQAHGMYANSIEWIPTLLPTNNENITSIQKIKDILTEDYITGQIDLMNEALLKSPHISIGIAKELIETFCKSILRSNDIQYDRSWDIPRLAKETNKILLFSNLVENESNKSIQKIISGITTIIQAISELRNSHGSGHGHEMDFKQLDRIYVRFIVSSTSEIILLWKALADKNKEQGNNLNNKFETI